MASGRGLLPAILPNGILTEADPTPNLTHPEYSVTPESKTLDFECELEIAQVQILPVTIELFISTIDLVLYRLSPLFRLIRSSHRPMPIRTSRIRLKRGSPSPKKKKNTLVSTFKSRDNDEIVLVASYPQSASCCIDNVIYIQFAVVSSYLPPPSPSLHRANGVTEGLRPHSDKNVFERLTKRRHFDGRGAASPVGSSVTYWVSVTTRAVMVSLLLWTSSK
ncbi:hypothetical protein J6590_074861 [Homalodisca vitripennis]|nr:hypothetical protein J6590_074861 [Homalodisca vitripennis]